MNENDFDSSFKLIILFKVRFGVQLNLNLKQTKKVKIPFKKHKVPPELYFQIL